MCYVSRETFGEAINTIAPNCRRAAMANCSRVHFHAAATHLPILAAHRTGVGHLCTFATRQINGIPFRASFMRHSAIIRCWCCCIFFLHFFLLEKRKKITTISIYSLKIVVILRNYTTNTSIRP